jgi:hypothetical protein
LGQGKTPELIKLAQKQELDVLVIFEVKVSENKKTGVVSNRTKMKLYNVATGEDIGEVASGELINTDVERARDKGSETDAVEKAFTRVFDFIDHNLVVTDVPDDAKLQESLANATAGKDRILQRLNEVRFYRSRGLIDNDQMVAAYKGLVGDALAEKLAKGKASEKKEAAKDILAKYK